MPSGLLLLILLATSIGALAQGVLAKKTPEGKIVFQAIDDLRLNGSRRVRVIPANTPSIVPNELKRLTRVDLLQLGLIRKDETSRLVRGVGASKKGELILPENFSPKDAVDTATAPGPITLEVTDSKKAKRGEPITIEEFYIFAPGQAERAALDFVLRDSMFSGSEEQLAAMEGFQASFTGSPLIDELRGSIAARVRNGIEAFEDGGEFRELQRVQVYADFGKRAFNGDADLTGLQTQLSERIKAVDGLKLVLYSLAASEDWDTLLEKYADFEPYQWSFPALMQLRERAIEESARVHFTRGRKYAARQEFTTALSETSAALFRDPENAAVFKALDDQRVMNSRIEAARNAASRKRLPKDSPEELRFRRHLYVGERAIQDKDYAKAEQSIRDATAESAEAPDILLLRAQLLAALDRHSEAMPLLDNYDRMAVEPAERERGQAARNQLLYDLEKKKAAAKERIGELLKNGEYTKLNQAAAAALKLDADDEDFVFHGGATAAVLRDTVMAQTLLKRYLDRSNSVRGDLRRRQQARRILAILSRPAPAKVEGMGNWFSGRILPEGTYYCPETAAFHQPVESIAGFKTRMDFQWASGRLNAISTTFEDDRGLRNYRSMLDETNSLVKHDPDSPGNFYFGYAGTRQVQTVGPKKVEAASSNELKVIREASGIARVATGQGVPRVLLADDPKIHTQVLSVLEGPVAAGFSGNPFFNPFIWDGFHYFTLRHDKEGRLTEAREWNADNLVRFTWSGIRLLQVDAFHKDADEPYYTRRLNYSGNELVDETYSMGGKSGRIRYSGGRGAGQQQIRLEDGGVHDGKPWIVRLRS